MYDVITIGGAIRDFTFYIEEGEINRGKFIFPLDSKILVKQAYFTNGGGASNVAVSLARFGLNVAVICRLGRDFSGNAILENFRAHKIEDKFIQIDPRLHTGVSIIIQKQGQGKTLFTYRGASDNLKIKTKNLSTCGGSLPRRSACRRDRQAGASDGKLETKWIYIASLTGEWQKILDKVFLAAKEYNTPIVWNPGAVQLATGKQKLMKYLEQTTVLILNRHEAAQLVNPKSEILNPKQISNSKFQIQKLLLKLYRLGPKIVAVTAGKEGAYVYDGQQIYYQPAKVRTPKDTTGAGDAFSSGFLAGLILFDEIKKALNLGIRNSAAVIKKIGAQEGLLTKRNLKQLIV